MIGYKLFTPEWTAVKGKGGATHPYQYKVGECYEEDCVPKVASCGFHFCENLIDCFNHYGIEVHNRIALIDAYGDIDKCRGACATNKIRIVREIPWRDAVAIVEEQEKKGVCNV